MSCPVCGKPYPCVHGRGLQTASGAEVDGSGQEPANAPPVSSPAPEIKSRAGYDQWRQEVVLRLRQHRARRRHCDSNASLELDFPTDTALAIASALASPSPGELEPLATEPEQPLSEGEHASEIVTPRVLETEAPRPRKVIRFPRHPRVEPVIVARPPIEEIELADPAPEAPRILDAPEPEAQQMDLLPSFADIRLDEAPPSDLCAELKSLPRPAPLSRRLVAGIVDLSIVLFACGLFAVTFLQIVTTAPAGRATLIYEFAVVAVIWLLFEYLFLVQGAATPGMRAAHLDLYSFTGRRASRFARGMRTLATALSAFSVGLGFAWAFVDEDRLGWHDRISQTYLKSGDRVIRPASEILKRSEESI